jgi:predicted metalloprotease with PDZ domain
MVRRQAEAAETPARNAAERRSSTDEADRIRKYQERRVARLIEGGFSEDEAKRILQQESEAAFQVMQASWEAQRSGESVDYYATANNPQAVLRAEMGDDAYARYLEAQGQPTTINITQVLNGSPGSNAGLQPGDRLVSYNGERVFAVTELRNLTMQGQPGEDVVIEVDRDGIRMQLTVPRGPIGITGSGANVRSMRWWGG